MKASAIALILFAAVASGCGHVEQQRQAQDYERFLKNSLGTVAVDAPLEAHASKPATTAVD